MSLRLKKLKSFIQFLNEVNYGSLEKDIRIESIAEVLKRDMKFEIENGNDLDYSGIISLDLKRLMI